MTKPATVDAYLAALAPELRPVGEAVRATMRAALPEAEERISYAIPAYRLGKRRTIYFAVWKKHVGLYPIHRGPDAFEARIAPYRATDATLQFPLKDTPHALIAEAALTQAAAPGA